MKNTLIVISLLFIVNYSFGQSCTICQNDANFPLTLDVTPSGGTGAVNCTWEDPNGNPLADPADANIDGIYTYTCTDANGCTNTGTYEVIINQPATLVCRWRARENGSASFGPYTEDCNPIICEFDGSNDVQMQPLGTGQSIPTGSTYLWNDGTTTVTKTVSMITLAENNSTYSITVTTPDGCESTETFTLTVNPNANPTVTVVDETCDLSNGSVTVNETFDSYLWDAAAGNATTQSVTGLSDGSYTVTVTDLNGCTGSITGVVNDVPGVNLACTGTDPLCNGEATGTATATPSNGTAPYNYAWDASANNQTTQTATALTAGSYTVTVTDTNGCTATCTQVLTDPAALTASVTCN